MVDTNPVRVEQPLKRILGWDDIMREVDDLVERIGTDYDAMLVITRGGMVPACLISERLDIRNILVAAVQLYTGIGTTLDDPVFLQFPSDELLNGQKILVVDDVWDSGRTAMCVRERIQAAGGSPTLAVLHYKPRASRFPDHQPDFYSELTDDWLVYPWDEDR
jgi:hypoxanthine phosphoribosyltransferase